ncbi:MAG: bifunctional methylenetetrahydrofolate dehydrogenase/methenyltetrahydrofolate cyclohydrolase [Acidobacteria bacterium RIFCSPLOWO2_12_FULL_65_11]|nr:MAG: bifunctional methylenetetrahydrofolate dehydrogenase/methenyltetrahydrofolate cyclohydrolase [Acidobacteria bacterium RIFCSPLOWO2_02_FULL_64_15]OFW34190.1 MAG: bifunctional methylenetetrahydrofolate dehydrogenase/methenyltetrahydrofolate cyclohydrolase [Acidobacteria bacterium RIFCSPLOWO2_12_FULL_65_11]
MSARLLNGTEIARQVRAELAPRVAAFSARAGRPPGLGILLVGHDPGSEIYVRNKGKAAAELGIRADTERLPHTATLDEVLAIVDRLNKSAVHDGILVQSPLPAEMGSDAEQRVFDTISPAKDVDGFHPVNVGLLVQNRPHLVPCTPLGIIELLVRSETKIAGARAVVIGRSDIVGKPSALLLLHRHATVTICHSKTVNLPAVAAGADILVAAIGRAGFVTRDFVKPGATVIDVGINRVTDPEVARRLLLSTPQRLADFEKKGSVLVGDVHPEVAEVAGVLTPVPGGVGPLTIAMLLGNTVKAAEASIGTR